MPKIMKAYQLGWSSNMTSTKRRKIYKNNKGKILHCLKKQLKRAKNKKIANKEKKKILLGLLNKLVPH